MDINELITEWQANDAKINTAVKLNSKTLDQILLQKARSSHKSLLWQRIVELSCHAIALILLFAFAMYNFNELPYAISAIALIALYSFLFFNCSKQIQMIRSIDNHKNIVDRQRSLMKIQAYLLDFVRLSVLFIPAFLSFPVIVSRAFADLNITVFGDFDLLKSTNGAWWMAQIIAYIILIPLGLWFYQQVNKRNIHKPWVARIIKKSSSKRVVKALEYLKELDELKTEKM